MEWKVDVMGDAENSNAVSSIQKQAETLTSQQVADFINGVCKNHTCPHCQNPGENWVLLGEESNWIGPVCLSKAGDVALPPPIIPTVLIACACCGYIKTFSLFTIASRLSKVAE